jgi:carboxymethylenebutenolidase
MNLPSIPLGASALPPRFADFDAADGELQAVRSAVDGHALPVWHWPGRNPGRGSMVLLPEIFGVDAFMRGQAQRWAAAGHAVFAPALFDRCDAGFVAAHDAAGIARGIDFMRRTPDAQALSDIEACVAHAAASVPGPVHLIGYCYGGRLAWSAAASIAGIRSAVVFYGNVLPQVQRQPRCPVMLHFGLLDDQMPAAEIGQALRTNAPMVLLHLYPQVGHGFVNPATPAFSPADAEVAWHRTTSFLDAVG